MRLGESQVEIETEVVRPGELFQVFNHPDSLVADDGSELPMPAFFVKKELKVEGYPTLDLAFFSYDDEAVDRAICIDPLYPARGYVIDDRDYLASERKSKLQKAFIDGARSQLPETHHVFRAYAVLDLRSNTYEPTVADLAEAVEQIAIVSDANGESPTKYDDNLREIALIVAMQKAISRLRLKVLFSNGAVYRSSPMMLLKDSSISDFSFFYLPDTFEPATTPLYPEGHLLVMDDSEEIHLLQAEFVFTDGDIPRESDIEQPLLPQLVG